MKTVSEWIRLHANFALGMAPVVTSEQLRRHVENRTARVFELIRSRVAVGFIRYESNRGMAPNYLGWLDQALVEYKTTRNLDALLDVAFYAIAEFQTPSIEGTYYRADKDERNEL